MPVGRAAFRNPYGVAYILERRAASDQGRQPEFIAGQAELFDLAAESFSVFPSLPRLARYRAALAHFQLAKRGAPSHATSCMAQIRRAITTPNLSGAELRKYFSMAYQIGDYSLAAELLPRWERTRPDHPLLALGRIKLPLATGALGPALEALDKMLIERPDDAWALKQREKALEQMRQWTERLPVEVPQKGPRSTQAPHLCPTPPRVCPLDRAVATGRTPKEPGLTTQDTRIAEEAPPKTTFMGSVSGAFVAPFVLAPTGRPTKAQGRVPRGPEEPGPR